MATKVEREIRELVNGLSKAEQDLLVRVVKWENQNVYLPAGAAKELATKHLIDLVNKTIEPEAGEG